METNYVSKNKSRSMIKTTKAKNIDIPMKKRQRVSKELNKLHSVECTSSQIEDTSDTQAIKKRQLKSNISEEILSLKNQSKFNCALEQTVSSFIQQNQHDNADKITLMQIDKNINVLPSSVSLNQHEISTTGGESNKGPDILMNIVLLADSFIKEHNSLTFNAKTVDDTFKIKLSNYLLLLKESFKK